MVILEAALVDFDGAAATLWAEEVEQRCDELGRADLEEAVLFFRVLARPAGRLRDAHAARQSMPTQHATTATTSKFITKGMQLIF